MAYKEALEAAGAKVIAFAEFGSYQGEWWAKVQIGDRIGWINGGYGSCSGCDAFEAEFGYEYFGEHIGGEYIEIEDARHPRHAEHAEKLKAFGAEYLDRIKSQPEAEADAASNLDWDIDAQAMVDFIKENAA